MENIPASFANVTVTAKANVYFDGKVVSHTVVLPDGTRKTLGLIYPGRFHFGTKDAERMEIVAGACRAKLDGGGDWRTYAAGGRLEVPANSGFTIEVPGAICEYVCTFIG